MELVPFAFFLALFLLNELLLLLATLPGDLDEFFAIEFFLFEIYLILFMFLRSRNQLLLVPLLLVLLADELGSETLLPHANLIDLLLIIFCQKNCL